MAYLGNDLKVAYPNYKIIDDISGSFNGSTTSFALLVSGVAPVPLPLNSQQCLISVAGVLQRPDDTGAEGFRLSGGNIVFSSAPATGADFFGVILAGADYVNAGGTFPDGSAALPSITFSNDVDTGIYRSGSGLIGFASNGISIGTLPSSAGSTGQVLTTDGSGTLSWADRGRMTLATAQNSTSGTSIDFTGIPSWVKRVTVSLYNVSTNGSSTLLVQIGSGSLTTSGYSSHSSATDGTSVGSAVSGTGFLLDPGGAAAFVRFGTVSILTPGSNLWTYTSLMGVSGSSAARTHYSGGGAPTLSGALDRLRVTTTNGTDTFDAGSINILYEG